MFRACIYVHRKSHIRAFFDNIDAEHSLGLSSWSYRAIIQDYGLRDPGEVSHGAMVLSINRLYSSRFSIMVFGFYPSQSRPRSSAISDET
jgi:hypothetical protein